MTPEDSIRLWFRILEERGECMDFTIYRQDRVTETISQHHFFHGEMDGLSAILLLLQKDQSTGLYLPKLPERPLPPAWFIWFSFLRYVARLPLASPAWSVAKTDWKLTPHHPETPSARAYTFLDEEVTQKVWLKAKSIGVGRLAFLLFHLDQAISPWLEKSSRPRHWLIPVHLRPDLSLTQKAMGNMTGFVDARIRPQTEVAQLDRELKKILSRGDHYGGWRGVALGSILGERILRLLVPLNDHLQVRTGVFTYLGNWQSKNGSPHHWFGFPPVLHTQPVGVAAGSLDGRQYMALQLHPSLSRSPEMAREALERWVQGLTSAQ